MKPLHILLNIIWLIFAGIPMAIGYMAAGVICCILVITIPWGIGAFRIANFILWPFGRTAIRRSDAGVGSTLGNVIWFLVAGIWLAFGHIVSAIALCITIIGIPLGIAEFKLIPITLTPLGRQIVPTGQPFAQVGSLSL